MWIMFDCCGSWSFPTTIQANVVVSTNKNNQTACIRNNGGRVIQESKVGSYDGISNVGLVVVIVAVAAAFQIEIKLVKVQALY